MREVHEAVLEEDPEPSATIKVCPDGPLLVRGDSCVVDADGNPLEGTGARSIALCRCGRSQLKPLCDGSQKADHPIDD